MWYNDNPNNSSNNSSNINIFKNNGEETISN